ncbi:MAG: aspartate kinase, partial [Pseudomonadota bacterium]
VQKYGGSSVADLERLRQVAKRVVETVGKGYRVVVVISAMGRTTDELLALAQKLSAHPARRELDMLLTAGERIASALLAMAISDLGQEAISFTGSQCGIITSDRHNDARILEVRPYRVQDELDRGRVVIIAGYQGVSYKREVTTLGRGGSDTTAVAMAGALGAEYCEICSDVDGVYSADPNQVDSSVHLEYVSYSQMQELAQYGAKVLNAQAVEFARREGIQIYARATSGSQRVTRVGVESAPGKAVGVAGLSNLVCMQSEGGGEQLAGIARLLKEVQVSPLWARLHNGHPQLLFDKERCGDFATFRARLGEFKRDAHFEEPLEAASVIGSGLGDDPSDLSALMEMAKARKFEVVGVDASSQRLTLLLRPGRLKEALSALHELFVRPSREDGAIETP